MGALMWRELVVVTRTPAYWLSAALYSIALTSFVVVWGDGIPLAGAGSNWQQFTVAERVLLIVLLPWTAARCSTSSRRELALLGFVAARPPSALLLARIAALAAALFALAFSALPVIVLMQQVAAAPPITLALDMAPVAALAVFVAAVTNATAVVLEVPIRVWAVSGGLTLVAAAIVPLEPGTIPIWLLAAAAATALCLPSTRSRLTYLPEDGA